MSLSKIPSVRLAAVVQEYALQMDIMAHALSAQITREHAVIPEKHRAKIFKLVTDCQLISKDLFDLFLEMDERQSYSVFMRFVEDKEEMKRAKEKTRVTNRELKQRKANMMRQQQEIIDRKEELEKLSSFCEHLSEMVTLKKINIRKQRMKKSGATQVCEVMSELEEELEMMKKKMDEEKTVHEYSEKFLKTRQVELEDSLQYWQQYTQEKLQDKEDQLNNTSCKRTLNLDRMMELRRRIIMMKQVEMEDLEDEEKKRKLEFQIRCAIKVQAWWRGCMVRKGFGNFKKGDDKKKDKKKKKGKGKK